MNMPQKLIPLSDHGSEILVLAIIAIGCMILAGFAIHDNSAGEASAWTAVLMAIINAIKERWQNRSIDRMGDQLAQATPTSPTDGQGEP